MIAIIVSTGYVSAQKTVANVNVINVKDMSMERWQNNEIEENGTGRVLQMYS